MASFAFWGVDFNQLYYAVTLANESETIFGPMQKSPLTRLTGRTWKYNVIYKFDGIYSESFLRNFIYKYAENSKILNGTNNFDNCCSRMYSYALVQYCLPKDTIFQTYFD